MSNVKCLRSRVRKFLFISSSLLLITVLFGCNLIGSNEPAALQVTSIPEASVFLDGKHLGKTPFFSDQLKSGEHFIKITVSEASYVDKITLTSGTLTVVNRQLSPNFLAQSGETLYLQPNSKGLFVSSMPAQADLTLDGALRGQTPILVDQLQEGEHKVFLSKAGYIDRELSIKTSAKYQLIADITLASEAAKDASLFAAATPTPSIQKVEILKTPAGFLRVRQEPSLNSAEIGRVKTGEQFEIVQETKDWIQIKFENLPASEAGKIGWISSQYTRKL